MRTQDIRRILGAWRRKPGRIWRDRRFAKGLKKRSLEKPVLFYMGVPEHSNLGDLAQYYCIQKYLAGEFSEYDVVEVPSRIYLDNPFGCRDFIKRQVKAEDLFVFQSGYCTQDLGGREDLMHQRVMQDFPDNKMLMLPQTVFFRSSERREQASRIYNAHKHLIFLARDQVSYETAKDMFPDIPVYAYPDIVTTLIGAYSCSCERKGILFCIRNDSEKFYSDQEIRMLKERLKKYAQPLDQMDTTVRVEYHRIIKHLQRYVESYFEKFAHYQLVITDRYHGTIFSLIANTPVIVIRTKDHKVITGADWFQGVYDGQVLLAQTLEEAEKMAAEILRRNPYEGNRPYFMDRFYKRLRGQVNI